MRSGHLTLFCVLISSLMAAEEPEDLLLRVRAKCISTLNRLPRYMCTQTVDRDYFEPAQRIQYKSCDDLSGAKRRNQVPLQRISSDRLRLNVATTSAGEIYSWAGDTKFHDSGLFDLVDNGPLQTGSFALFLGVVFTNDETAFSYIGENIENGRRLVEFSFSTPRNRSHYFIGPVNQGVRVGYEGTFTADADTLDLVHMVVRTTEVPDEVPTCESTTTFDYQRVRLRDSDFLLPIQTHLHMIMATGDENHSRTAFSSCHEFLGQSTLKFDTPGDVTAANPGEGSESTRFIFSPGQSFSVMLTDGIDTGIAAAGDPVHGKLTSAIRGKRPKVEIPVGTPVQGRIIKLEHDYGKPAGVKIIVRLETAQVNGVPVPFTASSDVLPYSPRVNRSYRLQSRGRELGRIGDLNLRGVTVFIFRGAGEHYLVKSGLESRWVTVGR
jgi:hypothetical protein